MRRNDSIQGAEGDVLPLGKDGRPVLKGYNYFLIRFDTLKSIR